MGVGAVSRTPTSVNLEEWIREELSQRNINRSDLANELFKDYLAEDDSEIAALKTRKRRVEEEAAEHREAAEKLEREADRLGRLIDDLEEQQARELKTRLEELGGIPSDPNHPQFTELSESFDPDPASIAQLHAEVHSNGNSNTNGAHP